MNPDTVSHILSFCGNAYLYVATINKTWRQAYGPANNKTSVCQAVTSLSRVRGVLPTLKLQQRFLPRIEHRNIDFLDQLLANKRPTALYTCTAGAVAGGNLQTLSWAVANGFPLDRFVCHRAASAGNLGMLKWALPVGSGALQGRH